MCRSEGQDNTFIDQTIGQGAGCIVDHAVLGNAGGFSGVVPLGG